MSLVDSIPTHTTALAALTNESLMFLCSMQCLTYGMVSLSYKQNAIDERRETRNSEGGRKKAKARQTTTKDKRSREVSPSNQKRHRLEISAGRLDGLKAAFLLAPCDIPASDEPAMLVTSSRDLLLKDERRREKSTSTESSTISRVLPFIARYVKSSGYCQ